jgi:hypothetical protein
MNKRIKELAKQILSKDQFGLWLAGDKDIEKFAELIVKDVLQTCEDHPAWTGRMIGEQIKQHFGVEP